MYGLQNQDIRMTVLDYGNNYGYTNEREEEHIWLTMKNSVLTVTLIY